MAQDAAAIAGGGGQGMARARRPALGVRVHLVLLVLLALLPAWGMAAFTAWRFALAERSRVVTAAQDTAREIATAVEREAAALRASLAALATSPALAAGDTAAFARQVARLRATEGWSVRLEPASDRAAAAPALRQDAATGARMVTFRQAVVPEEGGPAFRLALTIEAIRSWSAVLERVQMPRSWVASVIDGEGTILARVPDPDRFVGQPVHPDTAAVLHAAPPHLTGGWATGVTRDGSAVHIAWRRVDGLPWTVLVGVPRDVVDGAVRRALLPVLLAGLPVLALLSAGIALWGSARLARPLRALERAAGAAGRGAVPEAPPPSHVREIDAAGRALAAAAAGRRDREAEIAGLVARLESVLESTTDCVLVLDRAGRATYLNSRAQAVLGAAGPAAEADRPGRAPPLLDRLPDILGAGAAAACRRAVETGMPVSATTRAGPAGRWYGADAFPSAEGVTLFFRDVTAERQAAEALRASEARLQAVLDHVPVGVMLAEAPSGRMVLSNRRLAAMLGLREARADGLADYARFPAFDADGRRVPPEERPIARALAGEEQVAAEMRFRRGDGTLAWVRVMAAPIRDAEGRVTGAVAALAPIDAEREAEAALRESELRFRTLAEAMPQIVWSSGPDGRLDYVNPRYREVTGADPAAPGAPALPIHPDDRRATAAAWRRALATGAPYEAEYRLRRADGCWRWFVARALAIRGADGRVRRWIGAANDVTDLVETRQALERQVVAEAAARQAAVSAAEALAASEARFRGFAEASPDLLWILDPAEDRLHYLSPAYERLWGEPPPRGPGSGLATLTACLAPEDAASIAAAIARLQAEGGEPIDAEFRMQRRDGQPRWIRLLGFPMQGGGGMARLGGFARDVTQRREADERQRLLIAELNHRVKNTLATVLSLAHQTARRAAAEDPAGAGHDGFLADFQSRLMALARAHDLLTASTWRGAMLGEVAAAALSPWRGEADPGASRLALSGAAVWLAPRQALGLSLAIHEMATNAAKHGALRAQEGRVSLAWRQEADGWIEVRWTESGGPPAQAPTRQGFGTRLLRSGLAAELGAGSTVALDYPPEGFRAMMRFRATVADGGTA